MSSVAPIDEIQTEAVKAFGKEVAARIFGFLSDITRPPAKELGGLLADSVKYYRFKNQLRILEKAENINKLLGRKLQKVPLQFLANLLDNCSWAEDNYLQSNWATLLANATSKGEDTSNYITYVELLRQLSPIQAKCLETMYEESEYPARRLIKQLPSYQSANILKKALNVDDNQFIIVIDSLIRLNLIHLKIGSHCEKDCLALSGKFHLILPARCVHS